MGSEISSEDSEKMICQKCSEPKGETGGIDHKTGYFGPCGHEESRGDVGLPKFPSLVQMHMSSDN